LEVEEVVGKHGQAYRLKLPPFLKIHNVFHVSLLEPWNSQQCTIDEREFLKVQSHDKYEVKSIQDHRDTNEGRQYLVHWKGYSHNDDTWEPESHLENALEKVKEYLESTGLRKTKTSWKHFESKSRIR
jgi:hypothetical protein